MVVAGVLRAQGPLPSVASLVNPFVQERESASAKQSGLFSDPSRPRHFFVSLLTRLVCLWAMNSGSRIWMTGLAAREASSLLSLE